MRIDLGLLLIGIACIRLAEYLVTNDFLNLIK